MRNGLAAKQVDSPSVGGMFRNRERTGTSPRKRIALPNARSWLFVLMILVWSAGAASAADTLRNAGGDRKDSPPSSVTLAVKRVLVHFLHVRPAFDRNVTASAGVRGFTGMIPPRKAAFCMGVLAADAQFAEQTGDRNMAEDIIDASLTLMAGQKIREIPRRDVASFSQLQPAIDDYVRQRELTVHYELGQWAEAMRLVLLAAKTDRSGAKIDASRILTGPDNLAPSFLDRLEPNALPEGALRGLQYLKAQAGRKEHLQRRDEDRALRALEDIVATARAQLRTKRDWIRAYGEVRDQEDPLVNRAKNVVFPKVWAASRKPPDVMAELVVIKSQGDPWTFVLRADGAVVMTQGAVHLCYRNVSEELGDARVAFLIGHELSHLANRHFWHAEAFNAMQSYGAREHGTDQAVRLMFAQVTDAKGTTPEAQKAAQIKEIEADQDGLITAAMAGFDPRGILAADGGNFFDAYVSQITEQTALDDKTHPTPQARADFLRVSLTPIVEALDLFAFGVRLFELERYEDALLLFETFNQRFPGREVLNNIGLCHFRMAQQALAECDASLTRRFSIPAQIDEDTRAAQFAAVIARRPVMAERSSRMKNMMFDRVDCFEKAEFKRHIAASASRLQLAVEKDPLYLPARVNLSSVLVVNREYEKAMGVADEAIRTATEKLRRPGGSPEGMNNKALAVYSFGAKQMIGDLRAQAVSLLQALVRQHPEYADALYNLGVMQLEMGQRKEAEASLKGFIDRAGNDPLATEARKKLSMMVPLSFTDAAKAAPAPPPVRPGFIDGQNRKQLSGVKPANFTSGSYDISIYKSPDWTAYAISDMVTVVETPLSTAIPKAEFLVRYGAPLRTVKTVSGETLIYYGFAGDVRNGKIVKLVFFEKL